MQLTIFLNINDEVMQELQEKYPPSSPIAENTFQSGPINNFLPSYFDVIDGALIQHARRLTKGAGWPSQLDADHYRHILLSRKLKTDSKDLREQIAILPIKLETQLVDPVSIESSYVSLNTPK